VQLNGDPLRHMRDSVVLPGPPWFDGRAGGVPSL
jgi:hypothetical protein